MKKINIPLTVPAKKQKEYLKNLRKATRNTGRLLLFAGDQKIEHLNGDYFSPDLPREVNNPEHLFQVASKSEIGVFAAQMGLIARHARKYPKTPYLIKLNSKTNLVKADAFSNLLTSVEDVVRFKKQSKLNIVGVGYTIYIGSDFEPEILEQASEAIIQAHQAGLIIVIWMYPRGGKVKDEDDIHLIAGGAGVAHTLGADFVKTKYPYGSAKATAEKFKEVTEAAGNTGVLCVGGSKKAPKTFLQSLYHQIHTSKTSGAAVGRNIYQRTLKESIQMANAISSIVFYNAKPTEAYQIFLGKKKLNKKKK